MSRIFFHSLFIAILISSYGSLCLASDYKPGDFKVPDIVAFQSNSPQYYQNNIAALVLLAEKGMQHFHTGLAMSKDGVVIACPTLYLDEYTDVTDKYPERQRNNGRFLISDFTSSELLSLNLKDNEKNLPLHLMPFTEVIAFTQLIESTTGQIITLYPELLEPSLQMQEGQDLQSSLIKLLAGFGYRKKSSPIILLCNDEKVLQNLNNSVMPSFNIDLKLAFSAGISQTNSNYDLLRARWIFTNSGLHSLAFYSDAIFISDTLALKAGGVEQFKAFINTNHKLGVKIYLYQANEDVPALGTLVPFLVDGILSKNGLIIQEKLAISLKTIKAELKKEQSSLEARLPHLFATPPEGNDAK